MYLRQGRTSEVWQLAEEMVAVFQEQGLPDDALRALRLCAAAAQREDLTAAMARDYASQIVRSSRDERTAWYENLVILPAKSSSPYRIALQLTEKPQ